MSMKMLFPEFLLLACFAVGCAPLDASSPSRLSGTWISHELTGMWRTEDGKVMRESSARQLRVNIREDGSIDLGFTPIGEMTGADRLRRTGDRVEVPGFGHAEVTSSSMSSTTSELTIVLTGNSGERETLRLRARLDLYGKLELEYLASNKGQKGTVFATLSRHAATAPE